MLLRGEAGCGKSRLAEWLSQRARVYFAGFVQDEQARVVAMLGEGVAADLLQVSVRAPIERVNNRLVIG